MDHASEAHAYQSKVSHLQQYQIARLLQKTMDQYATPGYLDRYDEIVLDIGAISPLDFEHELGTRIEEALINFFETNRYGDGKLRVGKRIQLYHKHIEQFEFFLKHGYVHWSTASTHKPMEILSVLLQENTEELIGLLKKYAKKDHIRKRMIMQMEDPFLEQIVNAVAGTDGHYMNRYRDHLMEQQKNQVLVEAGLDNFRAAIWEIILAYLLVEVTGFSNRKSFLKYLIVQMSHKYRLSYTVLLRTMVINVKESKSNRGSIIDFEKLLISLQDDEKVEIEKIRKKSDPQFQQDDPSGFIVILDYFLKYNALPLKSTITSRSKFNNVFLETLDRNPKEFYAYFDRIQQNSLAVQRLINTFPDRTLNILIEGSQNNIIRRLRIFMEQLDTIAREYKLKSITWSRIKKQKGRIVINAYCNIATKKTMPGIQEFLFQALRYNHIDGEFIQILHKIENRLRSEDKNGVRSFVFMFSDSSAEFTETSLPLSLDATPLFLKLSNVLYTYYKKNEVATLSYFQRKLQQEKYSVDVLKLMALLLEVCHKESLYSVQDIADWIRNRGMELTRKGKSTAIVFDQLKQLMAQLNVDKIIHSGLEQAIKKEYKEKDTLGPAKEASGNEKLSPTIYVSFLNTLYEKLRYPSAENSILRIKKLIQDFAQKKHKGDFVEVVKQLKKYLKENKEDGFMLKILNQITADDIRSIRKQSKDIEYTHALVHYFIGKGRLPWWAKNTSMELLQNYMLESIIAFPKQFAQWFMVTKYKKNTIGVMNSATYEVFLKELYPSIGRALFQVQKIMNIIINEELIGIGNAVSNNTLEIRYLLLKYMTGNRNMTLRTIIRYLIKNRAKRMAILEEDFQWVFLDKLEKAKWKSKEKKELMEWIDSNLRSIQVPSTHIIPSKELIEKEKKWKDAILFPPKKEIIPLLKIAHTKAPGELLFQLKRSSFREKLIERLEDSEQITFVVWFLDESAKAQFLGMHSIFKTIRKQLTSSQYRRIWNSFMERVFLKLAIDRPQRWTVKDWSKLLLKSVSNLPQTLSLPEVLAEISKNPTYEPIKQILTETQILVREEEPEMLKKENKMIAEREEEPLGESIYVDNAGMIILGPYLPMLFERLGLLKNQEFKDNSSREKAMHSLQYAVTGKTGEEEQLLTLNKIICGIPIYGPVSRSAPLREDEKELIDGMLKAVIAAWSVLGNSSIEGLRETFLCREGRIHIEEDKYILRVKRETFDMLLDQIPWNIGTLKLSWMQKLMEVVWK